MPNKQQNPSANVPRQAPDEPLGDRGQGDKTWSPGRGDQGISNRPDDESDRFPAGVDPTGGSNDDSEFDDITDEEDEDEFEGEDAGDNESDDG